MVSVVVVTYNHENYIDECIDSILNQKTDFKFEIILGEDFSTDGTRAICQKYAYEFPEIIKLQLRNREDVIFINGKPTGRYNFIESLKKSSSKYIALCDGDDYWTDSLKLQKQVDFLESNKEYAGSFHDTDVIIDGDENLNPKPFRTYNKNIFNLEDTISTRALFHTSSFIFRKSLLEFPSWFTKVQSGDMALFTIIASKGPLYRVNDSMSIYRKNEGGITNDVKFRDYHKNRIILFKYLKGFCNSTVKKNINEVITFHKNKLKKKPEQTF